MIEQWEGFIPGKWCDEINVRSFIMKNYTEYVGDESFLVGPTDATKKLMERINELDQEELKRGGVYNADTSIISTSGSCSLTTFLTSSIVTSSVSYVNFSLAKLTLTLCKLGFFSNFFCILFAHPAQSKFFKINSYFFILCTPFKKGPGLFFN